MKRLIFIILFICSCTLIYYISSDDYYIPKPEALLKIKSLQRDSILCDQINHILFYHNIESLVEKEDSSCFSIRYPMYNARIRFCLSDFRDLEDELRDFQYVINMHEKKGAVIYCHIIENFDSHIYGTLCYLEGYNIATSSRFFLMDSLNHYLSGELIFNTSINSNIIMQNEIMKDQVYNFISSFRWKD